MTYHPRLKRADSNIVFLSVSWAADWFSSLSDKQWHTCYAKSVTREIRTEFTFHSLTHPGDISSETCLDWPPRHLTDVHGYLHPVKTPTWSHWPPTKPGLGCPARRPHEHKQQSQERENRSDRTGRPRSYETAVLVVGGPGNSLSPVVVYPHKWRVISLFTGDGVHTQAVKEDPQRRNFPGKEAPAN